MPSHNSQRIVADCVIDPLMLDPTEIDTHRDGFRERLGALRSLTELSALADGCRSRRCGVGRGGWG
jgi:hypothetical protein